MNSSYTFLALILATPAFSQTIQPALIQPQDRIVSAIVNASRVSLPNSVTPAVASAQSSQPVGAYFEMDHMILTLQPSAAQQAALVELLTQQQDPNSSNFHKFLTPARFAASFGASANDLTKVSTWLTSNGFKIDEVSANNLAIVFSGYAYQVNAAFNTQIRQYVLGGATHYANATAVQIPSALSPVVQGLVKLNDFHSTASSAGAKVSPQYTGSTGAHYLVPADYAVIYNLNPLYTNGFTGAAQTIALVGRSNVNLSDISTFRASYGLPANAPTPVYATGIDPGITANSDTLEMTSDIEWASAVAPNAPIKYIIAASTTSTDGIDLAAQYAVTHNVASILGVSYGSCETTTNNAFYNNLWQQAAVQGISVFVSAGDSGAAGCDSSSATVGTVRAVNGICSTSYDTCVGGTMFNDIASPGTYWLPGNNAIQGSAISYIPEVAWNESSLDGGAGLSAGGGGASSYYIKPYWQTGTGVPVDGHRDVPDVSLSAAQHDGYMIYYNGAATTVAGTSLATPSFAGIMALVNQKVGSSQGNINQVLYPLAAQGTPAGSTPVFHDITSGNNTVNGVTGYSAGTGYDQATGLGSVDATQLANNWSSVTGGFTFTASATSVNASPGVNGSLTVSVADLGTFTSPVSLTVSSLPTGVILNFAPGTITGSGSSVITLASSGTAISGTYPITITANGGSFTRTVSFNLVVVVSTSCTLAATPASLTVVQSQAISTKLVCGSAQGIFHSALTLSVTGAPTGITTAFSPASTITAGTGVSTLVVNAAATTVPGTYTLTVTATLPNSTPAFSSIFGVTLVVTAPSTFNVTPSVTTVSMVQGAGGTLTLTSLHSGSFNSPLTFSTSGLPSTVSATLSATSLVAPGDGTITVTLQTLSVTTPATYTMTVLVQGGGLILRVPIAVQVVLAPSFTLTSSAAVLTLRETYVPPTGMPTPSTASFVLTSGLLKNNFNSAVTFTIGTLPTGVTAAFSSATLAAPGSGSTTLTLTAAATATTGVSTITVTATGGTITRYINIQLTLTPPPNFSLSVNYPAYTLIAGSSMNETVTSTALYGYNSNINLTATAPVGFTTSFSSTTIGGNSGTSRLTIQPTITLAAGTYAITVTGTDPITGIAQSAQISFQVGSVTTTLAPTAITLAHGTSTTALITTAATAYSGNVVLSLTGLPTGVTYALSVTSVIGGSGISNLTLLASSSTRPGQYLVTITSSAGGIPFNTVFTLTIT